MRLQLNFSEVHLLAKKENPLTNVNLAIEEMWEGEVIKTIKFLKKKTVSQRVENIRSNINSQFKNKELQAYPSCPKG